MFSNKKNTHLKESASAAHDPLNTTDAGSTSGAVSAKKKLPAWVIFPVLAAVLLLAWFLSLFAGGKTEDSVGTPLNVVKAEKGTVKEVYNSTGTVESENTKTYYSPVTAPIKECRAVVGQTVKAGDLLVTFDTTDLERNNQQAQLTLQSSLNNSIAARAQNARTIDAANAASAQAAAQANALAGEVNSLVSQVDSAYAQYQANQQAAAQQAAQNAPKVQALQAQITSYNEAIASADAVISSYERGYTGRQVEINEALAAEDPDPVQKQIIKDTEDYNAALQSKSDTEELLAQAQDSLDALGVPPADDAGYADLLAQYEAKYAEWQAAKYSHKYRLREPRFGHGLHGRLLRCCAARRSITAATGITGVIACARLRRGKEVTEFRHHAGRLPLRHTLAPHLRVARHAHSQQLTFFHWACLLPVDYHVVFHDYI